MSLLAAGSGIQLMLAQAPAGAPGKAKAAPQPARTAAKAATPEPSPVDSVIELVKAKLGDDLIIRQLRSQGYSSKLSTADMIKLKGAGASDALIAFMLDPTTPPAAAAPAAPVVAAAPPPVAPTATVIQPVGPTPPQPTPPPTPANNAKLVCVYASGTGGDTAMSHLLPILTGDGTVIRTMSLKQVADGLRIKEAEQNKCAFVFEAAFETKAKGTSLISSAIKKASSINKNSGAFGNDKATQADIDKKDASAANLSKDLAPEPKDKVKIAYKLFAGQSRTPLLGNDKEVNQPDLEKYLNAMVNDVVNAVLR